MICAEVVEFLERGRAISYHNFDVILNVVFAMNMVTLVFVLIVCFRKD